MNQDLLSDTSADTTQFLELCNAMYERELNTLSQQSFTNTQQVQGRLKSLPHYIKRTAGSMLKVQSPLDLDFQNASWFIKQAKIIPTTQQTPKQVQLWYEKNKLEVGLIIPVLVQQNQRTRIIIDCIDRVDDENQRFRSNYFGWFYYTQEVMNKDPQVRLLKPNRKVLSAACSGHQWQGHNRTNPSTLTLRELLLSCQINWQNLKKPTPATKSQA